MDYSFCVYNELNSLTPNCETISFDFSQVEDQNLLNSTIHTFLSQRLDKAVTADAGLGIVIVILFFLAFLTMHICI